jgi:hypothetical protein
MLVRSEGAQPGQGHRDLFDACIGHLPAHGVQKHGALLAVKMA